MKRHAVTLVIAALAVLATAYLLFVDRGTASDAERAVRAHHVFTAFRADEITRIDLERPNDHLILERDAAASEAGARDWRLRGADGTAAAADQAAAAALVVALDSASPVRAASDDPAEFVPVRASGTITMGRIVTRLQLGKDAAAPQGAAYLRVEGAAPIVIAAKLARALLEPADRYRAKEIVPNVAERLDTLAVDQGDGQVRHVAWTRTGPAMYRLADGERASRASLDRVELALVDLRAESFLAPDDAARAIAAGGAGKVTTVTLRAENAEPLTLHFGGECLDHLDNAVVLRDASGPLPRLGACVAKAAIAAFAVDPASLVEHHVFQARADEVSELRLAAPDATLDLARKGNGWHERAPEDRDLSPGENDAAAALLDRMVALEGDPHAPAGDPTKPTAADARSYRATLRYGEPAVDDTFAFDGNGAGAEMNVDARAVRLLTPTKETLRPLLFWDPPLDRLHVDEVTLRCDGREEKIAKTADGWAFGSLPADGPAVLDVVDAIAGARAARWIPASDAERGAAGVGAGATGAACDGATSIALHVTARGDRPTETACVSLVDLGKRTNGETIVRVDRTGTTSPGFAVIASDFRASACALLVDRHRFVLPDDARTVTLRAAGVTGVTGVTAATARRVDLDVAALRNVVPDEGDAANGSAAAPGAAIAALDGLVADDVAHLGPPVAADALAAPALVVTIAVADGGAARTLRFGREIATDRGPVRRATVDDVAAVFTFASTKLAPLFAAADVIQRAP